MPDIVKAVSSRMNNGIHRLSVSGGSPEPFWYQLFGVAEHGDAHIALIWACEKFPVLDAMQSGGTGTGTPAGGGPQPDVCHAWS